MAKTLLGSKKLIVGLGIAAALAGASYHIDDIASGCSNLRNNVGSYLGTAEQGYERRKRDTLNDDPQELNESINELEEQVGESIVAYQREMHNGDYDSEILASIKKLGAISGSLRSNLSKEARAKLLAEQGFSQTLSSYLDESSQVLTEDKMYHLVTAIITEAEKRYAQKDLAARDIDNFVTRAIPKLNYQGVEAVRKEMGKTLTADQSYAIAVAELSGAPVGQLKKSVALLTNSLLKSSPQDGLETVLNSYQSLPPSERLFLVKKSFEGLSLGDKSTFSEYVCQSGQLGKSEKKIDDALKKVQPPKQKVEEGGKINKFLKWMGGDS